MKVTATTIASAPEISAETRVESAVAGKSMVALLSDLFKARLTFLVLLTTLVGFYIGSRGPINYLLMFHAVVATAMVAAGAAALNELLERDLDAKMKRTASRPIPSGQMTAETALIIGATCSAAGLIYLAFAVNLITAVLGAVTLCTYLFVYTPLKRLTTLNTAIGAIPGA